MPPSNTPGSRAALGDLVTLGVFLFAFWMLLSGFLKPLLMGLGLVSCVFVVWISRRLRVIDFEGHPRHLNLARLTRYALWLTWKIIVANVAVIRCIVDPRYPISPTLKKIPTSQHSALGQTILANSITLTPGTVSVDVGDGYVEVHSLTRKGMQTLSSGNMDRRVRELEEKR